MHDTSSHPRRFLTIIGYIAGMVTVGILGLHAGLFAVALVRNPTWGHLIALLYNWQGLTAGVLAILAAGLGAAAVLHQTWEGRRQAEHRRARRAHALRAALPMLLDSIAEYLADAAKAYARLAGAQTEGVVRASGLAFPALPAEIVDQAIDHIETVDADTARPLILFMRQLQVHRARARDARLRAAGTIAGSILTPQNVVSRLVDTAELYARCSALFVYARADAVEPAQMVTFRDVQASLALIASGFPDTRELEDEIERRVRYALQNGQAWPER